MGHPLFHVYNCSIHNTSQYLIHKTFDYLESKEHNKIYIYFIKI